MQRMRLPAILSALAVLVVSFAVGPARAAERFGTDGCDGVRPGSYAEDTTSNVYTIGFMYKGVKGKDKATYFVTVGDPILPSSGTKVWKGSSGPPLYDLNGRKIGTFTYAYSVGATDADTFALVRVDKKMKANPSVCHFGGPTGVFTDVPVVPFEVQYYGQGLPFATTVPARSGVAYGARREQLSVVGPAGLFAPLGDAGGPVLAGGKAVGIFTDAVSVGYPTGFVVSRLLPAIDRAEEKTGIKLSLLTSKAL